MINYRTDKSPFAPLPWIVMKYNDDKYINVICWCATEVNARRVAKALNQMEIES